MFIDAIKHQNINNVKYIIENGADVNANRDAALMGAITIGNEEIAELLLENGANPQARNNFGIKNAITKGYINIAELLAVYGADVKEIFSKDYKSDNPKLIKELKNRYYHPNEYLKVTMTQKKGGKPSDTVMKIVDKKKSKKR